MEKTENLDLKSKLNIVSGKTEINDFKSYHAMSKKGLNSLNNEFIEYLKASLNVTDNLIKIDNDILMAKSEFYVNIKNRCHIINNDTLITKTNCIKLKSTLRENVKSLENVKNNLYSVKKDSHSNQIDFKKLKEEFINNFNKRGKIRSINTTKIKTNKASSKKKKNNPACTIKDSGTSTDVLLSKNMLRRLLVQMILLLKVMPIHVQAQMILSLKNMLMRVLVQMILLLKIMSMHVQAQMILLKNMLMRVLVLMILLLKIMSMHVLAQMMYVLMKMNRVLA